LQNISELIFYKGEVWI